MSKNTLGINSESKDDISAKVTLSGVREKYLKNLGPLERLGKISVTHRSYELISMAQVRQCLAVFFDLCFPVQPGC